MKVEIKPELEAMIEADVERGSYQSVDEYIERAVQLLHEQEQWFVRNQGEISELIEEGWAELERGEGVDAAEAIAILRQRRSEWIRRNSR